MAERIGLTKTQRFEVFKRDSFKCQYCGRQSPDVILEVDHILPVAEGGTNDILNLITSCRDCNRGKGKRKLSDTSSIEKQKAQLDEMNKIREQTEMMIRWKQELMHLTDTQIDAIEKTYENTYDYTFSDRGRQIVRALIRRFGFQEVVEATEIACDQYDADSWFDKLGGICYNRRKWRQEHAEQNY